MVQVRTSHTVTVTMTHDMTWADLCEVVANAGVPETAKLKVKSVDSYSPVEPGYEEITFTW